MTSAAAHQQQALLLIRGLKTQFRLGSLTVHAVDGVDLTVAPGEILGLVGESGSGKSVLALSILRLVDKPGKITDGTVCFEGRDIAAMSREELKKFRGADVGMIFQQPQGSLNPVHRIGWQVAEPFIRRGGMSRSSAWKAAVELLRTVGLPAPEEKALSYPHQLSGGQAQRTMIAIALALHPRLLIADEPTTALDVTIQAQILDLLKERCKNTGTSLILVTHDLAVVAKLADRIAVMYAGRIVEEGPIDKVFTNPRHPYTIGLLKAAPSLGATGSKRLEGIPGTIPDLIRTPAGCAFAPRCETRVRLGSRRCLDEQPPLFSPEPGRQTRCWEFAALAAPVPTVPTPQSVTSGS